MRPASWKPTDVYSSLEGSPAGVEDEQGATPAASFRFDLVHELAPDALASGSGVNHELGDLGPMASVGLGRQVQLDGPDYSSIGLRDEQHDTRREKTRPVALHLVDRQRRQEPHRGAVVDDGYEQLGQLPRSKLSHHSQVCSHRPSLPLRVRYASLQHASVPVSR